MAKKDVVKEVEKEEEKQENTNVLRPNSGNINITEE
jgi:hypothetical protein